jgi:hypothetical protein
MSNTNKELATGLRNCSVDSKSRRVDWQEALGENMEGWQAFEIEECEECERSFLASSHCGQDEHRYVEPEVTLTITGDDGEEFEDEVENECMGTVNYFEGPMMNFFHPCELRERQSPTSLFVWSSSRTASAALPLRVAAWT